VGQAQDFDIVFVGQAGRLQYEALILVASIRAAMPRWHGRLICLEPQPGPLWPRDPRIPEGDTRALLIQMGTRFHPFESRHFGAAYPQGNKIEGLAALPPGRPFLFLDTDSLILRDLAEVPFDFTRPSASLRREGTWPKIPLYGPGYDAIWRALYTRFGLDLDTALDRAWPETFWRRYPYFNAGFFYAHCPVAFGTRFTEYAVTLHREEIAVLASQTLDPWLDQVALPLVLHSFGGGLGTLAPGFMDASHHCHYRFLPLLYAREPDAVVATLERVVAPNKIKKVLKAYEPARRMIYQGRGTKARALFDQNALPRREQAMRNRLKRHGFWMR